MNIIVLDHPYETVTSNKRNTEEKIPNIRVGAGKRTWATIQSVLPFNNSSSSILLIRYIPFWHGT